MVVLDIGCGENKKGDLGVDIRKVEGAVDVICDVSRLPFKDCSFSSAIASDIFEHFPRARAVEILKEWLRILEQGGSIMIKMPNLYVLANAYLRGQIDVAEFARKVYGGGTLTLNPYDFHYAGYDHNSIGGLLSEAGYTDIRVRERGEGGDWSNLLVQARKPRDNKTAILA